MFDISPLELLTIALIALIVFGPQRLPEMARKIGSYIRELRDAASELTAGLDREVRELKEPFTDLKEDLTKPVSELKDSLDETAKGIQNPLREMGDELRKPISSGGPADRPQVADTPGPPPGQPDGDVAGDDADAVPPARWVGDEPEVGVSPSDAWKGIEDPVPPGAQDSGAVDDLAPLAPDAEPGEDPVSDRGAEPTHDQPDAGSGDT